MKIKFRDKRVTELTERLTEMIQPFLGRREYGNLRVLPLSGGIRVGELPNFIARNIGIITWSLDYERIFGSSSVIRAEYLINEKGFEYHDYLKNQERRTGNVNEVLTHFRTRLEYILPQRKEDLMECAKLKFGRGLSHRKSIMEVREFAERYKEGEILPGPTNEEVELFKQFCDIVYSKRIKSKSKRK